MASQQARDLEHKLESLKYDMERVGRQQQNHAEEIAGMGQYFDYLDNYQLHQAFETEQATGK
ncbi:hypothetical protein [Streptomyces olivaceus]|uniref:hypothetical protein n=1 Tax=Streptomyces olivaceus TaxID=47716 RepID=UPI0040579CF5